MGTETGIVNYRQACIEAKTACPATESQWAMADYALSVYGDLATSRFDGVLTKEERDHAGVMIDSPSDYLLTARTNYFSRLTEMEKRLCKNDSMTKKTGVSKQFGEARMITVYPGCVQRVTTAFDEDGISGAMAANPRGWVILVEEWTSNSKERYLPEIIFFTKVAEKLGIRIENPTFSSSNKEVLDEMNKRFGLSVVDCAVAELVKVLSFFVKKFPNSRFEEQLRMAMVYVYDDYRKHGVSLDTDKLMASYIGMLQGPSAETSGAMLADRGEKLKRVTQEMSIAKTREILGEEKGKKALFIGTDRLLPIFEAVYR